MSHKRLLALVGAAILACGSGEASAYTWIKCGSTNVKWSSNVYAARASTGGFPAGPWRNALASVVGHWNANPSNLGYSISYNDSSVGLGNGQSEVWWDSGFGAPAAMFPWINMSTCRFTEADIKFDNTVAYTTSTSKSALISYGGASRPFQTTAMHEFGHAGGLAHTATTYNIMGSDWTHIHANGGTATAYHGEDAAAGMVAVYGLWAAGPQDLGVVHWRWVGSSGQYSTHNRTRIFNCSGTELPKVAGTAEPVYRVSKGQCVRLELSYENMGRTSPLSPTVGYYLSSNDSITTADTFLGSNVPSLGRGQVLTTPTTLTVPSSLVSGSNYWLGAIIDRTNAISEKSEANNASYIGLRIN